MGSAHPFDEADRSGAELSDRVLDAALQCVERWGITKTTIEDVVEVAGVSRATIYRLFPGGRDVMFEALRVREINRAFATIADAVGQADNLTDAVAFGVAAATSELQNDRAVAVMLELDPGAILDQLAVGGLPRILMIAKTAIGPAIASFGNTDALEPLLDVAVRLTISYFLAPHPHLDLINREHARVVVAPMVAVFAHPGTLNRYRAVAATAAASSPPADSTDTDSTDTG